MTSIVTFRHHGVPCRSSQSAIKRQIHRPAVEIPYLGEVACFCYRFMDIGPNEHDGRDRYCLSAKEACNYLEGLIEKTFLSVIVLVEGELDAATLMQEGFPAIAVKRFDKLLKRIDANPVANRRFIVLRDNDDTGADKGDEWSRNLVEHGIRCTVHQLPGDVNDANGYLMAYGSASLRLQMQQIMQEDENCKYSLIAQA